MMDEDFAQGTSLLHSIDPRVKIVVALFFISVIAVTDNFTVVGLALLVAFLLSMAASLPISLIAKRLLAANSFVIFLWLTLPLTYGGEPMFYVGPFSFSREGILLSALITLKTNTIVLTVIALLATSTIASLGHALEGLGLPGRLSFLLLFSYRYIFVIHQEYLRLVRAAQMRCFRPATTIHTYRTVAYLFGMTLVKSYNRGDRIHQAMLLRGFNGHLIPLSHHTISRIDIIFLMAGLITTAALIFLHFT
ncbi:MAG: cobalt/nickel transport system permease protein [Desulforhopalus sp.]|jgi:cobalt/nickel transport system permease protein